MTRDTMTTVLIGIDDTDNDTSRGTGWLARQLLAECVRRGHRPVGVTRQQFLLDPRIPYTTHNSGACVSVRTQDGTVPFEFAFDFVAGLSAEGSDPGVCLVRMDAVPREVVTFGRRAAVEVVEMDEALEVARRTSIELRPLGGSGLGVIGALGAVGLHADGNHGRFIELPGLRELGERVGREDLTRLGIRLEHRHRRAPRTDDVYETLGWVRPNLTGGEPVLPVTWSDERHAWLPVDRRRRRPLA